MNQCQLVGRLAREVSLKYTSNTNTAVIDNALAVYRDKDTTDFINIKAFGKTAENIDKFCTKGTKIGVVGRIEVDSYEKDGKKVNIFRVIAEKVYFLEFLQKKNEEPEEYPNNDFKELNEAVPF